MTDFDDNKNREDQDKTKQSETGYASQGEKGGEASIQSGQASDWNDDMTEKNDTNDSDMSDE